METLAAITVGMVGGREGLGFGEDGGLPLFMLQKLEAAEYIVEVATAFEAWVASQDSEVVR